MRSLLISMALVAGCAGDLTGATPAPRPDGGEPDAAAPPADAGPGTAEPSLRFVQPTEGARFPRDGVLDHGWAAQVILRVEAAGVSAVDFRLLGGASLGRVSAAPFETVGRFPFEGEITIEAVGLSPDGVELVRDEVGIVVEPPTDPSCHAMLDALELDWEVASATRGIADPVRVQPIIGGVSFRYVSHDTPAPMLMDCSLAPRLHELTALMQPHGLDEVVHIGIYNYRCIGGGDPDSGDCTPSQHAYAKAIDLHAFGLEGSDVYYSTETDWVIRSDRDVCPGTPASEADRVLHELACAMWSEGIFHIVLTPDYNAAHRNHFHVDLTAGSMFIGETVTGVDPLLPTLGH